MHDTVYIYGLCDNGSISSIRYIGQTLSPSSRLKSHLSDNSGSDKAVWIRDTIGNGGNVNMLILGEATGKEDAHALENAWIIFGRSQGWDLVNGTNPGDHRDTLSDDFRATQKALVVARTRDSNSLKIVTLAGMAQAASAMLIVLLAVPIGTVDDAALQLRTGAIPYAVALWSLFALPPLVYGMFEYGRGIRNDFKPLWEKWRKETSSTNGVSHHA